MKHSSASSLHVQEHNYGSARVQYDNIQLPRIEALIDDCVVPRFVYLHFCLARQLAKAPAPESEGHTDITTNQQTTDRALHTTKHETGEAVAQRSKQ